MRFRRFGQVCFYGKSQASPLSHAFCNNGALVTRFARSTVIGHRFQVICQSEEYDLYNPQSFMVSQFLAACACYSMNDCAWDYQYLTETCSLRVVP